MEMLALEWGGQAGACWEIWKCEPCCGEPCNPLDGVRCFLCWFCPIIGILSFAKLFSHGMSQDCALVNHVLPPFIPYVGGIVVGIAARHNIRVKLNVGLPAWDTTGLVGDFLMMCFCGLCTFCQHLRAVKREDWDWIAELTDKGFKVFIDPCICCIDHA